MYSIAIGSSCYNIILSGTHLLPCSVSHSLVGPQLKLAAQPNLLKCVEQRLNSYVLISSVYYGLDLIRVI